MSNPAFDAFGEDQSSLFDLSNHQAYLDWRRNKLDGYPDSADAIRISIADPASPSPNERDAISRLCAKTNMALYRVDRSLGKEGTLKLANALGLTRLDVPLYTEEPGVTEIQNVATGRQGEYAPYTDRALSWHTDGYYNATDAQVLGMVLHCERPAEDGGVSSLFDPEIAYIRLRDENPDYIRVLMEPDALTIPENVESGALIRPARTGPVYSVINGYLHMRFSARKRYIEWKPGETLERARAFLMTLLDDPDGPAFHHRLAAGEGLISNNVLHTRSAFQDGATVEAGNGRLFLRARFADRLPNPDEGVGNAR